MYHNEDLKNIIMPVDPEALKELLVESRYDEKKTEYLVEGFRHGFSLEFEGEINGVQRNAPNLKLCIGSETQLWNKVMKEVKAKRYAGPFKKVPFKDYIQSPIGLVPKDKGKDTRLIFHLSYPKDSCSVNSCTPKE